MIKAKSLDFEAGRKMLPIDNLLVRLNLMVASATETGTNIQTFFTFKVASYVPDRTECGNEMVQLKRGVCEEIPYKNKNDQCLAP